MSRGKGDKARWEPVHKVLAQNKSRHFFVNGSSQNRGFHFLRREGGWSVPSTPPNPPLLRVKGFIALPRKFSTVVLDLTYFFLDAALFCGC